MQVSPDQLAKLEQTLLSQQEPLHNRFRALFTLKAVGGSEAIRIVAEGTSSAATLAPELAGLCSLQRKELIRSPNMCLRLFLSFDARLTCPRRLQGPLGPP
jgi:hypothetical protein